MRTYTYRLDHDLGFAPNPFFGWCSLACCMPKIRKRADCGDIIIGMAGSGALRRIHPQLIYWMQIEATLRFDEYWRDPRFVLKKPTIPGPNVRMVGDNTYRHDADSGEWVFEMSMHYIPNARQKDGGHVMVDTSVDRVLLARRFTYWGKAGPPVPDHLIQIFPKRRGYKYRHADESAVAELHEYVGISSPQFIMGPPADWDNIRYFPKG